MPELTLQCPIRGTLKAKAKSADGLTPTEEKLRIEAIQHLLNLGYPKTHIKIEATIKRFGNSGRNSFRSDLAVLDCRVSTIPSGDIDRLLKHALVLVEVKRDNAKADYAKNTQVQPMLDFAKRTDSIGVYWDDVEQRVFWREIIKKQAVTHDGPIALLPRYGQQLNVRPLTYADIQPADSLVAVFDRIEQVLHAASVDAEPRYNAILALIVAKLYDENSHEAKPDQPLLIQDPSAMQMRDEDVEADFTALLDKAAKYYGKYLPTKIDTALPIKAHSLSEILTILAPVKITGSRDRVIQDFYMKFAKHLYRWDMAQYFTPTSVTEFIVDVLNPGFGEHVKDPACGSADFLTAAFRKGKAQDPSYADCVWGSDNSINAVQVAVLNMVLNGDGKSNIVHEDSLESTLKAKNSYDILICNPPFGTKIVDKRQDILTKYDLGYDLKVDAKGQVTRGRVRKSQETGILFVEVCIKQCIPGGRIGIILPNGYLGNRSDKYVRFRKWLLQQCRVATIASFPRFTFKGSGADVSASVVFLEKRKKPLKSYLDDSDYPVCVELIENVGWYVGDKKGEPIYKRDPTDGTFLVDESGDLIIDADFGKVLSDLTNSAAAGTFPWLGSNRPPTPDGSGWSLQMKDLLADPSVCLDPKRHSRKYRELRDALNAKPHFTLGQLVDFIPQRSDGKGGKVTTSDSQVYRYVELQDVFQGDYRWTELRGWALPDRAKHFASAGDIFIGSIWGSVGKWFMASADSTDLVVTNGFHRLRMKPNMVKYTSDVLAALSTEAYRVQMRALATGSDGLAEVCEADAQRVIIPKLSAAARKSLDTYVQLLAGSRPSVRAAVDDLMATRGIDTPQPPLRPSHSSLV